MFVARLPAGSDGLKRGLVEASDGVPKPLRSAYREKFVRTTACTRSEGVMQMEVKRLNKELLDARTRPPMKEEDDDEVAEVRISRILESLI